MAFTPDGMFYVSGDELTSIVSPGVKAIGGMMGFKTKEEAINEILQTSDYDTTEGRNAALQKIRAIDPEAYFKYKKMNDDYEAQQSRLETDRMSKEAYAKSIDVQVEAQKFKQAEKKYKSRLKKDWIPQESAELQKWLLETFPTVLTVDDVRNVKSRADAKRIIRSSDVQSEYAPDINTRNMYDKELDDDMDQKYSIWSTDRLYGLMYGDDNITSEVSPGKAKYTVNPGSVFSLPPRIDEFNKSSKYEGDGKAL